MSTYVRLVSARIINEVTEGRSLSECLDESLPKLKDSRDRAFVQAVCYGVCRFYTRLDVILSHLLQKPMNAKDSDVHALLLVGLYQLMAMRIPEYAAVTETVNATEKLEKSWARGFVNAILREYLRQREHLESSIKEDNEALYAHPEWWIDKIKKDWPDNWESILEANNQHPPFSLRVNQRHQSREQYLAILQEHDITASSIAETQSGIILDTPMLAEALPSFAAGYVSVQDGAAQLAAELLMLEPGQRVLDACAAPGGKLTHLFEVQPKLAEIVAVESDEARIALIKDNLKRLKVQAECLCVDAGAAEDWWDGAKFDRILLDAPCSASGVVRRHPDIKLLRQPNDTKNLAREQARLLKALWPLLKSGGIFLYATCSIFPEENQQVIQAFLDTHPDAKEEVIEATWGLPSTVGRQVLPGMHNMDGFYYARLRKA